MIDYSQLDVPRPKKSDHPEYKSLSSSYKPLIGMIIMFFIFGIPFIVIMLIISGSVFGAAAPVIGGAVILLSIAWVIRFLYKHVYQATLQTLRFINFAAANGFEFKAGWTANTEGTPVLTPRGYHGVLSSNIVPAYFSNEITGKALGVEFSYYNLVKPTRKGFFTILEVKLNGEYPHVLLDSRFNNKITSNVAYLFGTSDKITLEGDFPKYFDLYSKADSTITLQVIEPSLMQSLIDDSHKLDIEIIGDRLYMIIPFTYPKAKDMRYYFEAASQIVKNLDAAPL